MLLVTGKYLYASFVPGSSDFYFDILSSSSFCWLEKVIFFDLDILRNEYIESLLFF